MFSLNVRNISLLIIILILDHYKPRCLISPNLLLFLANMPGDQSQPNDIREFIIYYTRLTSFFGNDERAIL